MSPVYLIALLCFLSEILRSDDLPFSERQIYMMHFAVAYSQLKEHGQLYPPPWITKQVKMSGMRTLLVRRLTASFSPCPRKRFNLFRKLVNSSQGFERYNHFIYDPSRLYKEVFSHRLCERPVGCCWHPGIGRLLVTTFQDIISVNVGRLLPGRNRFESLVFTPPIHSRIHNIYGIVVALDNGDIVISGNNCNKVVIYSSKFEMIAEYTIFLNYVPNEIHFSGVCFSHNFDVILCFSSKGIQALRRSDGQFLCTFGSEGSKPGQFRGEGQIIPVNSPDQPGLYAVSDCDNNRDQIIQLDFVTGTCNVVKILGHDLFYKPLGLALFRNVILTCSYHDGCFYSSDDQLPITGLQWGRLACVLPNGEIVVCCQTSSTINVIRENWSIPPKPKGNCLTMAPLQFSKS